MEKVFWRQIDPSLVERAEKLLARWLGVDKVSVTFLDEQVDDYSVGVLFDSYVPDLGFEVPLEMDWNELSNKGLIVALNFSIFHPRGLAICRESDNGSSPYLLQVEDTWEYTEDLLTEAIEQLNHEGIWVPGLNDE